MKQQLMQLQKLRSDLDNFNEQWRIAKEEFENSNSELLSKRRLLNDMIAELSVEIQNNAIAEYEETGNKNLYGGIKIKFFKELQYEAEEAVVWAKNNAPMCFKFDSKTFEKIVKANPDGCNVARIIELPKATIPAKIEVLEDAN